MGARHAAPPQGRAGRQFGRDPFAGADRENAHLFVLAEPLSGRPDLLADFTDTSEHQPSFDLRRAGLTSDLTALLAEVGAAKFSHDLQELQAHDLRPDGVAWTSYGLAQGRTRRNDGVNERAGELEIGDNGSLRLYHSQLSRPTQGGNRVLVEAVAVGSVRRIPRSGQGRSRGRRLLRQLVTRRWRNRH